MTIEMTTLPSGLRVLSDRVDAVESVALGVWIGVGARHEAAAENGLAHLVEHMIFKGTGHRSAQDIARSIESVGGDVNAYTGREVTAYHVHLLAEHMPLALDVLADMLQHSVFAEAELSRERQVILQEIGMVVDTPDDLVFDLYQAAAYPGQSLGRPILGDADLVARLSRDSLQAYVRRFYTPSRMVIAAAGRVDHSDFVSRVQALFTDLPPDQPGAVEPARYVGGEIRTDKPLEQTHVVLGFQGVSRSDSHYYAAVALANILGGGMSSRLWREIREKRGLAYNASAFHTSTLDDGQFVVYAASDPARVSELIPVLCDELCTLPGSLYEEELVGAQAQMKSSLLMSRESMLTRADQMAKHLLFHGRVLDVSDLRRRIEDVRLPDVRLLAEGFFSGVPTLAAVGPLRHFPPYAAVRGRFCG